MKSFRIDSISGDLVLIAGTLVKIDRNEALVQRIRSRLRMIRAEWFLDTSKGLPWEDIFTKNPNYALIEAEIRGEVEDVEGVAAVTSITSVLNAETRTATLSLTVTTDLGELLEIKDVL